jgi:hypothetical protein
MYWYLKAKLLVSKFINTLKTVTNTHTNTNTNTNTNTDTDTDTEY